MLRFAFKTPLAFLIVIAIVLFLVLPGRAWGAGVNPKTYIPVNAKKYLPDLKQQVEDYFADFPDYAYFGGLIEQESCISLTWHSCWNPTTTLDTAREYGAGLGQLTKAYNSAGGVRFDSLESIRAEHFAQLHELSWSNILQRPDLQMRAIVLMSQDNYKRLDMIPNHYQRIAFSDAAYNGGLGGVYRDRRLCGLTLDCDPKLWFGNVEKTCTKSKVAIYGRQSACDINRTHVSNVLLLRMQKYSPYLNPVKTETKAIPIVVKPPEKALSEPVAASQPKQVSLPIPASQPVKTPLIIASTPLPVKSSSAPLSKASPVTTHWWSNLF